jgi:hypothetical protein
MVPETLNISLRLISQNLVTHNLVKDKVYFYFAVNSKYQTLPPVMKFEMLWEYKDNNDQKGKSVYYCCGNTTNTKTKYDYLKPVIITTKTLNITAKRANI